MAMTEHKPDDTALGDGFIRMADAIRSTPHNIAEEFRLAERAAIGGCFMGLVGGIVLMYVSTKVLIWWRGKV